MSLKSWYSSILTVALLRVALASTTCYYSNGDIDTDGYPCDVASVEAGKGSSCCHANDVCWSDGSCSTYGDNVAYWMSCTDQTWSSSSCATIGCEGQQASDAETWLVKCYPLNSTSCCLQGGDTCCGDSSSIFFTYNPGTVVAILDSNGTNTLVKSTGTSSTASSTGTGTSTGTSSTTSATTTGSSSTSSTQAQADTSNNTVEIALGVVLGIVVVAAVFGMTTLWMKLKSERALHRRTEMEFNNAKNNSNNNNNNGDRTPATLAASLQPAQDKDYYRTPPPSTPQYAPTPQYPLVELHSESSPQELGYQTRAY